MSKTKQAFWEEIEAIENERCGALQKGKSLVGKVKRATH